MFSSSHFWLPSKENQVWRIPFVPWSVGPYVKPNSTVHTGCVGAFPLSVSICIKSNHLHFLFLQFFHRSCTIVPDISRAVLKFTEGEKMRELEKKWFGFHELDSYPPQIPQRHEIVNRWFPWRLTGQWTHLFSSTSHLHRFHCVQILGILEEGAHHHNKEVESSNFEEFSNIFYIEMEVSHTKEISYIVEGECDQATPKADPLEVGVAQNGFSHFPNKSVTHDEI